jgi:HSP20 family protein
MNLVPWKRKQGGNGTELAPLDQFRSEMERLFDRFFDSPWENFGLKPMTQWAPSLDLTEDEKEVTVRAEVPGVDPQELDISISGDVLTIAGEKKETQERNEGGVHHQESFYGSFRRSVPLPSSVDVEHVNAEHANGVVTIHMTKTAPSKSKRIEVKAN